MKDKSDNPAKATGIFLQVGTQLDELSGLVSKALKVAENSRIPRIFGPDNCGALGRIITSGKEPRWK